MEAFPYLERTIEYNNSDWTAVFQNLRKAQRRWGMILKVLKNTVATVQAHGIMYKAVENKLLLYSSNILVVTGVM